VHRFGSRRTILVDTVVVQDSREEAAYRVARQRLELIASTLVEPERFENLFARVMSLVPPEELQDVLIGGAAAPLTHEDQERLARMVREGFQSWNRFHERFAHQQRLIREQPAGLSTWRDLEEFLRAHGKAESVGGFTSQSFAWMEGNIQAVNDEATVLRLADGNCYACGDYAGMPVVGPIESAKQLGLNLRPVVEVLQRTAFPKQPVGAGHFRWAGTDPPARSPFGVLIFLRQTVRTDLQAGWVEHGNSLHCYVVSESGDAASLEGEPRRRLLDGLFQSVVRTKPEHADALVQAIATHETRLINELSRPDEKDRLQGLRHAVIPLFAAIVAHSLSSAE
jgi:hypothetical protein